MSVESARGWNMMTFGRRTLRGGTTASNSHPPVQAFANGVSPLTVMVPLIERPSRETLPSTVNPKTRSPAMVAVVMPVSWKAPPTTATGGPL